MNTTSEILRIFNPVFATNNYTKKVNIEKILLKDCTLTIKLSTGNILFTNLVHHPKKITKIRWYLVK